MNTFLLECPDLTGDLSEAPLPPLDGLRCPCLQFGDLPRGLQRRLPVHPPLAGEVLGRPVGRLGVVAVEEREVAEATAAQEVRLCAEPRPSPRLGRVLRQDVLEGALARVRVPAALVPLHAEQDVLRLLLRDVRQGAELLLVGGVGDHVVAGILLLDLPEELVGVGAPAAVYVLGQAREQVLEIARTEVAARLGDADDEGREVLRAPAGQVGVVWAGVAGVAMDEGEGDRPADRILPQIHQEVAERPSTPPPHFGGDFARQGVPCAPCGAV